jgi:hypothetical protein
VLVAGSVSQIVLVPSLATAATGARSPFLRSESFRLLSILFNPKLNPKTSEIDELAARKMQEYTPMAVASICASLKDEDMQKTKRVRDVLKAAEKVLDFAKLVSCPISDFDDLLQAIGNVDDKLQNQGAKMAIEKIRSIIHELQNEPMIVDDTEEKKKKESQVDDDDDDDDENRDNAEDDGADKKDKKKKKKKKKRGKK